MHGTVKPGQEEFAAFLTNLILTLSPVSQELAPVLVLYTQLLCGDPQVHRHIPSALARRHDLYTGVLHTLDAAAHAQATARHERDLEAKRAKYRLEYQRTLEYRKHEEARRTETALYQLQHWQYNSPLTNLVTLYKPLEYVAILIKI